MIDRAQRGSRVIYVAASARELPSSVQEWLAEPTVRAASSPDIYDALASLAGGKAPLVLIVSIEAVDWTELDFFSHVHQVSPDTLLCVTGGNHQASKIDAAIARGARLFDADLLNELLAAAPASRRTPGPAGLLAGSLRTEVQAPASAPRLARVDTPVAPASPEPAAEPERPAVRLVNAGESEEADSAVPFPWSPAPNRPQRTPPKQATAPREGSSEGARRGPVKLTPEELAALLEPPTDPEGGRIQEGGK